MTRAPHLLLLAGSGEAREIAKALSQMPVQVSASLFETDHWSGPLPVSTRSGGFGGDAGFRSYLQDQNITAVLDATHPFAARISDRTWRICHDLALPYAQLDRPDWRAGEGDDWTEVETAEDAAALTTPGRRYFVTTGRETLPAFREKTDRTFLFRQLREGPSPEAPPHIAFVPGSGPFSAHQEQDLFEDLRIDGLICKNAGGTLSRTKLDAARALGLQVILLRRPPATGAPVVHSVAEALDWVRDTCL